MGGVNERWFEQTEHGHHLDLAKNLLQVCPGCIGDEGLRCFVALHAQIECCDFCGGPGPQGLSLGALFDYMGDRISTEWDRAEDTLFYGDGDGVWESGVAGLYDAYDLLGELGDPLGNEGLREAFVAAFVDVRISRNAFRLAHHEVLTGSWVDFKCYVKEHTRYLFLRSSHESRNDDERIPPERLLERVGQAAENGDLIRILQPGATTLYRARQHPSDEILATPAALGSPPRDRAGTNRMSPVGIPMFYGSEQPATALAELRPGASPRLATVGTWTTARRLRYLDLVDVDVPTLFDMGGKSQRPWRRFLKGFANDVSLAVSPEAAAVEYVPTQIFTEYVRQDLGGSDPVRGIRYRSAARPESVSWVFFVDAEGCTVATPGWESEPAHWLALETSSLQRFQAAPSWTEIE